MDGGRKPDKPDRNDPKEGRKNQNGRKVRAALIRADNWQLRAMPTEVWAHIFSFLTDPNDIWSVINTCPTWRAVVYNERVRFLFPLTLPLLLNGISGPELLRLRGVCRLWRNSVDYLLENGPHYRVPENNGQRSREPVPSTSAAARAAAANELVPLSRVPHDHPIFAQTTLTFRTVHEIMRFMALVGPIATENPIPWRSVRFSPVTRRASVSDIILFEMYLREFVVRYGEYISRFQYTLPVHETATQGRRMLISLLHGLSNVRTLHFEEGFHWLTRRGLAGRQYLDMNDGAFMADAPWEGRLNQDPFPRLRNLISVNCPRNALFNRDHIQSFLEAYNRQIQSVQWVPNSRSNCLRIALQVNGSMQEQRRNCSRSASFIQEVNEEEDEGQENAGQGGEPGKEENLEQGEKAGQKEDEGKEENEGNEGKGGDEGKGEDKGQGKDEGKAEGTS